MASTGLRKEVQQYIRHADERFLKMVHAMSREYENTLVVGYTAQGKPISKADLTKRVKTASKRVKSGDFIPHEELEKEMENW